MKNSLVMTVTILALATAGLAACGGGDNGTDNGTGNDVIFPDHGGNEDVANDQATTEDTLRDTSDTAQADAVDVSVDTPPDVPGEDVVQELPGDDTNQPEDVVEDVPPVYNFCNSLSDCQPYEVCDMAIGICEERSSYKVIVGYEDLYQFKPAEGQSGDFIVLDGARFLTSTSAANVRADIAKTLIAGTSVAHSTISPHRILGVVPSVGGVVSVVFQEASPGYQHYPDEFVNSSTNVYDCDGTTPPATGVPGGLGEVGPYAAGYVDVVADDLRIYYPAECGSIRRPGVPGTYPVLVIIPEGQDVNFPFINFDYVGQILATWGIVTVSMKAEVNSEDTTVLLTRIKTLVPGFINMDLGAKHSAMTGVYTSDKMAYLVFGTGADALNQAMSSDGGDVLKNKAAAAIAMAPSIKLDKVGASYFMALYGPNDKIANNSFATGSYDNYDSPKWKVQVLGGNHSLFTDHQMYYGGGYVPVNDGDPEIMRKEQMYDSMSMILPLLQAAFGMDEPFSDQLKNSFNDGKMIVTKG